MAFFQKISNYLDQMCMFFAASAIIPNPVRPFLLRARGIKLQHGAHIAPGCLFKKGDIKIGSLFVAGVGVYFDGRELFV